MHILISNDDGIHAPGIHALYDAMKDLGELHVVAPDTERSAVGHAITLSDPIKTQKVNRNGAFFGYAVGGTPADCVKLAVYALMEKPPDLVISGINLGPNAGISVIYSGTVSAATEGTILGIPSIAVSMNTFAEPHWATAAHFAKRFAKQVLAQGLPAETLLNVNVPNLPLDQVKGVRLTRMGRSRFVETFDRRVDPRGNIYYWMDGQIEMLGDAKGTDLQALDDGFVSMTPIWFDLTHESAMEYFRKNWGDEVVG
ncbi:MAG: 5'/3'-nucleotidase SurE [bacterium]